MKKKAFQRNQINLFETQQISDAEEPDWKLPDLKSHNIKKISLDTEGALNIWSGGKPCGLSICIDEKTKDSYYIPFAHKEGFNFDLENVKLWAKDNLYDLDIYFANFKHDFNSLKIVGIDLELGNNRYHDIMHSPVVLNPRRQDLDLDTLLFQAFDRHKAIPFGGDDYKSYPMENRPSHEIWNYACQDAIDTLDLASYYAPQIASEGLQRVLDTEDALLPCVAHMERQGVPIDVERLHRWKIQLHNRYIQIVLKIYQLTGLRVEPTKTADLAKLFYHLKIKYNTIPDRRKKKLVSTHELPSIKDEDLLKYLHIEPIKLAYEAKQIRSIESRAINKFTNSLGNQNILRYSLNQLKAVNSEGSQGAVTGRFSSSGGGPEINGVNIQQVMEDEKQEKIESIADFPIRDLFLPAEGMQWLSADAMQIEFRLFAYYSQSERLLKAYQENPLVDFHNYVQENIIRRSDMPRKIVKNINFSKIYGVGIQKLADMYLKCSYDEAKEKSNFYNKDFPEARELMDTVINLVKYRGYVKTVLGRKHKFGVGIDERYYAALNYIIQGSAADIMKVKLIRLYETRKETGFNMRFTVHDEVDGDIPDLESAQKVHAILNEQDFDKISVPILWETSRGKTWKQIKDINSCISCDMSLVKCSNNGKNKCCSNCKHGN